MTWQIIEDSSHYSYNASHAYSVAGDSLYGAYLKSHYPVEFYEVFLNLLKESGEKDRLAKAINEAETAYKIKFPRLQFGQDNRYIKGNPETKEISSSIKNIKGFGNEIGEELYELGKNNYSSFLDFLINAEEKGYLSKKYEDLIKINYFSFFGCNLKLLNIFKEFTTGKYRYSSSHTDKTKTKRIELLKEFCNTLENKNIGITEQIICDQEILGYINTIYPKLDKKFIFIVSLDLRFAPRLQSYCLANGKTLSLKVYRKTYDNNLFYGGDILRCKHFEKKNAVKYIDGKYVEDLDSDPQYWLTDYDIISPEEFDEILNTLDKKI
jgi:DNA polymerase III alpha subunit